MSDWKARLKTEKLVLQYELDASPEKLWRAISIDAYRKQWLPNASLVLAETVTNQPGREVQFKLRDQEPPYLESTVTFQIAPTPAGGAILKIIQELTDPRLKTGMTAANSNRLTMLRAA